MPKYRWNSITPIIILIRSECNDFVTKYHAGFFLVYRSDAVSGTNIMCVRGKTLSSDDGDRPCNWNAKPILSGRFCIFFFTNCIAKILTKIKPRRIEIYCWLFFFLFFFIIYRKTRGKLKIFYQLKHHLEKIETFFNTSKRVFREKTRIHTTW